MKKKIHKSEIEQEQQYVAFLEKRVNSDNYKKNVTPEEYKETQEKLKKARFRLKLMDK